MNCCHSPSFGLHRSNRPPRSAAFKPFAQVNSSLEQPFLNSRLLDKRDKQKKRTNITHEPLARSSAEEVCRRRQLQIEQTGAGSTVKYHGMYGAKDAVAQLAGTLPQRAVVPCFVRGARLRVCVRVSALRVCSAWLLCVAVWEERSNHIRSCVRCELLAVRAQEPWRVCRLGDVTYTRFAQLGLRLRGSVRFEVRGRRVCRTSCVCVCARAWSHAVQRVFC